MTSDARPHRARWARGRPGAWGRPARLAGVCAALALVAAAAAPSATAQDGDTPTTTQRERTAADPVALPSGLVAYVTADGGVWIGSGDAAPTRVADGAALGPTGQAAVSISPDGTLVAFVGTDATVRTVPIDGGASTVIGRDVPTELVGVEDVLAWLTGGEALAYVTRGTEEDVRPRPVVPQPLTDLNSFRVPLPTGTIGNLVAVVGLTGEELSRTGDPSLRSFLSVAASLSDPYMVFDTAIPGTDDRYTLSFGAPGADDVAPTPLAADDPEFAPDGSYLLAVGPAKGYQEILKFTIDNFGRSSIAQQPRICGPEVSPDATRVVFGGGEDCDRLMLVSAEGGRAFDVTPLDTPETARFGLADLGWTADGRFVTFPDCEQVAEDLRCAGPTVFLEPDSGRVRTGPEAATVAPIVQQLVQDVWVDVEMRGPLEFRRSFQIDADVQGALTETEENGGLLEATLTDGAATLTVRLTTGEGSAFVSGTLTAVDPGAGIDRTFLVLARPNLIGLRVVGLSGVWYSTDELPFATGQFNMAIRRR